MVEYDHGTITILDLPKVRQEPDSMTEASTGKADW